VLANGVSDVPGGINLGNSSVAGNKPSGAAAGGFSTTGSHTGEAFMCSLEKGYLC